MTHRPVPARVAGLVVAAVVLGACSGAPGDAGPPATVTGPGTPTTAPTPAPTPTPDEPTATTPPPDPARVCAEATAAPLTPEQLAGQLVMAGVPADDPASGRSLVARWDVGGVFLAGRSSAPAASVAAAVRRLVAAADTGVPLHVAVDQEGGRVQTLEGDGVLQLPSGVRQGTWSADRLRRTVVALATGLRQVGVTLDLAPVADVVPEGTADRNPPIGVFDRQFGSDPAQVGADVAVWVRAAREAGVLTTVKHFPGLGRVRVNTDTGTGATDRRTDADDPALQPFREGIAAGAGAVMVSTALYPRLDPENPAAFSRAVVTGLLRGDLGWDGVVVSDDLGSAASVADVPAGERAVRFVAAGGDVVLTNTASTVPAMVGALRDEAAADPGFAGQVRGSALRVLESKADLGLLTC